MEIRRHISASQFFVTLFVSRVVISIALNAGFLGGEVMTDSIPACLLAMAAGLVIAAPVLILDRISEDRGVLVLSRELFGPAGKAVPALLILYLVTVNGTALGLFHIFLSDALDPDLSAALTVTALLLAALYGACRGLETVARCAVCVFVILLAGCGLVFGIVAFRFSGENLEPLFARGFSQTRQSTLLFVARTSAFADMAVLLPMVRGRKAAGFLAWSGGAAAFIALLLFLMQGCLGRYASTQAFPVHALSAMTEIRSMQRLDAVFASFWMMGLAVKLACDLYACRVCFSCLSGRKSAGAAVGLTGFAVLLLAFSMAGNSAVRSLLLDTELLFLSTAAVELLPLPVLLALLLKRRKEKKG